jgi:hypothetical protein
MVTALSRCEVTRVTTFLDPGLFPRFGLPAAA